MIELVIRLRRTGMPVRGAKDFIAMTPRGRPRTGDASRCWRNT
ncbi:hypothetical protein [Paractinoplanes lichenicola]|nr:hypothetical protein [Actinoplanes lichenicola]